MQCTGTACYPHQGRQSTQTNQTLAFTQLKGKSLQRVLLLNTDTRSSNGRLLSSSSLVFPAGGGELAAYTYVGGGDWR